MIHVDRVGSAISPGGTWPNRSNTKKRDAIADGPSHKITDLYKDVEVRKALEGLFNFKCAYCEIRVAGGADWDVEHFRPKGGVSDAPGHSGYYWKAYDWDNLYMSCAHCNQSRVDKPTLADPNPGATLGKLDQFPLATGSTRASQPNDNLALEFPLLLDPCVDPIPASHLQFHPTGGVAEAAGSLKGKTSIQVFGLDRRRLRVDRREYLNLASEIIDLVVATGTARAAARDAVLDAMSRAARPFSAMASAAKADPTFFGL